MSRVLYLGMANDIFSPLLLVPDFDVVYVICKFDSAFAKNETWQGQKEDIKQVLELGSSDRSFNRWVNLQYNEDTPIYYLEGASEITEESDDGDCWRLDFIYNGKSRKLVYFHHREFIAEWPKEIYQIDHVMSMSAEFPFKKMILQEMIFSRCIYAAKYYMGDWDEIDSPYQIISCHRKTIHCYDVQALRLNRPVIKKLIDEVKDIVKGKMKDNDKSFNVDINGGVDLDTATIKTYLFLENEIDENIEPQRHATERLLYDILL